MILSRAKTYLCLRTSILLLYSLGSSLRKILLDPCIWQFIVLLSVLLVPSGTLHLHFYLFTAFVRTSSHVLHHASFLFLSPQYFSVRFVSCPLNRHCYTHVCFLWQHEDYICPYVTCPKLNCDQRVKPFGGCCSICGIFFLALPVVS